MKKALSLLLAIVMVFSLIPAAAFAADVATISFETTFEDTMTVGDTFTVTGYLANNVNFATMTLSLKWNEEAVAFTGFDVTNRGALVTEVFTYTTPVINQELGIIVSSDPYGYDTNGKMFVANFEIVGSGDLGIGLKTADATEFEFLDTALKEIEVILDLSAVEGLTVAGGDEGAVIPDGAPFTAITTDAGDVIAIEQQEDVEANYATVPYYIVTIPEGAGTVYLTAPDQVVMEDWNTGAMQATGYAFDVAGGWSTLYVSYDYEESDDGPIVEIPMSGMVVSDMYGGGEVELCFVEDEEGSLTHAFGIEDASYACLGVISFRYGEASTPEEPTVSEIPEGAAFVDMIAKVNGEDKPVTIQVMDDHYKVLVPLGTTAVYVIYNEGVPYIDDFGYAAVRVTGVEGAGDDGYSQTTSGGKTTIGLLMKKAAANGAGTIDLISLDYENRTAVGIIKADESAEDWFSFTYPLAEGEHYAILPEGLGYTASGSPIASNGYNFTVSIDDGYEVTSNFAVKVNGTTVATEPGEVTVDSVSEDLFITVEGVDKIYNAATDYSVTVDLSGFEGEVDGMMYLLKRGYESSESYEIELTPGKKHTITVAASEIHNYAVNIRSLIPETEGYEVVGYDINGERCESDNGYLVYGCNASSAQPGKYVITPIVEMVGEQEPNLFTVTVNDQTITPEKAGMEECDQIGEDLNKYILTLPAGTTSFTLTDESGLAVYETCNGSTDLCGYASSCQIEVSDDVEFYCIWNGASGDDYYEIHLYVEVEGGSTEPEQPDVPAAPGYTFATSADVTADNGGTAVVHVKVTGHSDENITTYNAYDVTLTFDSDKLEYVSYDGAVKSDNGQVKVNGSTIRIVGCGADKDFGTEIAALTFRTKAEGAAAVTIGKVQVSDKEESVKEDAPEATARHDEEDTDADETPETSIIVVPYTVTKPGFISGNDKILHGEDYTFSYTDTINYTYADLTVMVGGVEVTPTEENGVFTIENVTGAIEITATQTPNSYDVTKPENVTGPDQATYGEDYIFTVTPSGEDMAIDTVTVTDAEGNEIPYTINAEGEYVIAGTDISGEFTITVTEKEMMTTVTFSGIEETEIEGGLTQTAEIGKDFTFTLIKQEGFDYTVMVGDTELTETEGAYTIPAELVVKGGVAVTIEKVDNTRAAVDVVEYINLDGKTMFLVTAKWGDRVLAYGEGNTMFWSSRYTVAGETEAGAYCWLVVSTDEMNTIDLVKAAAETAIVEAAEGTVATAIQYNYDINGTTRVDVNDAQLVYDMYNASYMEFNENLPMLKFLEADMETDSKLDTKDVAAIISYIVSGANA